MEATEPPAPRSPNARLGTLSLALNLILLGWLLYGAFGRHLTPGGGVSLIIANDLPWQITELSLSHPGGSFALPVLDADQSVGTSIPVGTAFDATVTFKGPDGVACKEAVKVKPVGELLVVVRILPKLEEATLKSPSGAEEKVFKAAPGRARLVASYQGPVQYN
ncbi:hypothetical protein OJF2_06290 [Aquisphaera giovannonii]|uniref:Uncharacterized protein n=1 Tax=Aquisphaera giovannonii TaxID=406548 RepID=A0A5B9VWS6_9BACT|nr:hypothetical protein [Aquisphaera giovannonii]QEH32160.1 hypothetical protein OJF2_06290 [Aquisphaera giovannonii]